MTKSRDEELAERWREAKEVREAGQSYNLSSFNTRRYPRPSHPTCTHDCSFYIFLAPRHQRLQCSEELSGVRACAQ